MADKKSLVGKTEPTKKHTKWIFSQLARASAILDPFMSTTAIAWVSNGGENQGWD